MVVKEWEMSMTNFQYGVVMKVLGSIYKQQRSTYERVFIKRYL